AAAAVTSRVPGPITRCRPPADPALPRSERTIMTHCIGLVHALRGICPASHKAVRRLDRVAEENTVKGDLPVDVGRIVPDILVVPFRMHVAADNRPPDI